MCALPVTECTQETFELSACKRRVVEANYQGSNITFDGGISLLRQADHLLLVSAAVARVLEDPRRQGSVEHDGLSLLRQRLYALALLGYEISTITTSCAGIWPCKPLWTGMKCLPAVQPCAALRTWLITRRERYLLSEIRPE